MRHPVKSKFLSKRTTAERKADRKNLSLDEAAISDKTRSRYVSAMFQILPVLEAVPCTEALDFHIAAWIEDAWKKGKPLYQVSDALCALHFYEPWTKKLIPNSWRLFSVWRRLETPARAPPLTARLVHSLACYCVSHQDLCMAALFLVGFFGLLRTGELLALRPCDILVSKYRVIISLLHTKTGQRKGMTEVVQVDDMFTVEVLRTIVKDRTAAQCPEAPLWRWNGSAFRNRFAFYCEKFFLQSYHFRPYSLRRGGATALFQKTKSMDTTLVAGRWESQKSARIYIADALSYLPGMTFSDDTLAMLQKYPPP